MTWPSMNLYSLEQVKIIVCFLWKKMFATFHERVVLSNMRSDSVYGSLMFTLVTPDIR